MSQPKSDAPREAREQAKEYDSPFAGGEITLDDGTVIEVPPHPNLRMLDDDAQPKYDRLELELESYERHPDIDVPEQKIYDKSGNLVSVLPADTRPGPLKIPHRKTDADGNAVLLDPPYNVQVAQIALGPDYEKLRAGTIRGRRGSAVDVWRIWNEQGQKMIDRQKSDSKSDEGAGDLADVSAPDRE
jgi:hypothetical protein